MIYFNHTYWLLMSDSFISIMQMMKPAIVSTALKPYNQAENGDVKQARVNKNGWECASSRKMPL